MPNVKISQLQSIGMIATYLSTIFITGFVVSVLLAHQNGFGSANEAASRRHCAFISDTLTSLLRPNFCQI
jgi:hypothetical protein